MNPFTILLLLSALASVSSGSLSSQAVSDRISTSRKSDRLSGKGHNNGGVSKKQPVDFDEIDVRSEAIQTNHSNEKLRGLACVVGGALAHLTLGTIYCWGNFLSYAPDYLKFFDGKLHPGVQPDALLVIPITMVAQAIAMPFGPALTKRLGASNALLLGSWITAAAVYLASYQKSLGAFVAAYALLFGIGCGLGYTAPMAAGWKWLPNAKGLVSGGILAGLGAGGFIFSLIGSKIANPTGANPVNGRFADSVYTAFPLMLRRLAILYAGISLVGSLLVSEPARKPEVIASQPANPTKNNKNPVPTTVVTPAVENGLSLPQALRSSQFWLMWSMVICSATAALNTASVYKQFAATSSALAGDDYQALVGGIGALFNGVGHLFWGYISDIIGFKNSFKILTVLQATLMLTFSLSTASKLAFAVNTCLLFFCLAGNLALIPPATQRMFGPHAGMVIYGVLYSAFAIASVVGRMLTKALVKSKGWTFVFQTMTVMSLVGTGLVTKLFPVKSYPGSVTRPKSGYLGLNIWRSRGQDRVRRKIQTEAADLPISSVVSPS
eukprot:scaffold4338_cov183-Ochromonas_danica.AAC.9